VASGFKPPSGIIELLNTFTKVRSRQLSLHLAFVSDIKRQYVNLALIGSFYTVPTHCLRFSAAAAAAAAAAATLLKHARAHKAW
jgi:hypothetical protein